MRAVRFWAHDTHAFPLPEGHKFPIAKYPRLREALLREGLASPEQIHHAAPASWEALERVHQHDYLARVRDGRLSDREVRVLGLPWSAELVDRGRRSTQSTVEAARDAVVSGTGMNLGGGTHHAGRAVGRGYCLFNDLAVAVGELRRERPRLGRIAIVDCDVHQGDGTAELLQPDPTVFTLSLHGGANYPFRRATSDLDVELASGTGDDEYLDALANALGAIDAWGSPDLVFYLAGADPWEGDRLGRLALTKPGLAARDAMVLDWATAHGAAVCIALAGGYAPNVDDTVEINLQTVRALLALGA